MQQKGNGNLLFRFPYSFSCDFTDYLIKLRGYLEIEETTEISAIQQDTPRTLIFTLDKGVALLLDSKYFSLRSVTVALSNFNWMKDTYALLFTFHCQNEPPACRIALRVVVVAFLHNFLLRSKERVLAQKKFQKACCSKINHFYTLSLCARPPISQTWNHKLCAVND